MVVGRWSAQVLLARIGILVGDQSTSANYQSIMEMMEEQCKLCRKCGKVKPVKEFCSDAHQYDGRSCYCKDCINARQREYIALRKQGRSATLAKFTNEELLNELKFRLWQEEAVIQ